MSDYQIVVSSATNYVIETASQSNYEINTYQTPTDTLDTLNILGQLNWKNGTNPYKVQATLSTVEPAQSELTSNVNVPNFWLSMPKGMDDLSMVENAQAGSAPNYIVQLGNGGTSVSPNGAGGNAGSYHIVLGAGGYGENEGGLEGEFAVFDQDMNKTFQISSGQVLSYKPVSVLGNLVSTGGVVANINGSGSDAITALVIGAYSNQPADLTFVNRTEFVCQGGNSVSTAAQLNVQWISFNPNFNARVALTLKNTNVFVEAFRFESDGYNTAPHTLIGAFGGNCIQNKRLSIYTVKDHHQALFIQGTLSQWGNLVEFANGNGVIQLAIAGNGRDFILDTTTGSKIGTSTSQRLGFWNVTPVAQPTTSVASATVASPGAGNVIKTDDTFDGYTLRQVVKALRQIGLLQ